MINLKEDLIQALGIEKMDESGRDKIIAEVVKSAWEEAIDKVTNELNAEELADLQQFMGKKEEDFVQLQKRYGEKLRVCLLDFNLKLNELVYEFRKKYTRK